MWWDMLATLGGIACLVGMVWVLLFMKKDKSAFYQVDRDQILALLKRVQSGDAHDMEWRTFLSVRISADEFLEHIRARCEQLDDHYRGTSRGRILNRAGREKLAELVAELEAYDHKTF
ncbi:hypothetical protein ACFOSD_15450 [Salinispirillum marinum]|uniref:Uncharacterized protein n=2 Tax=Saccharospirillaceae TaxID=255527 RepID=A0ABV8BHB9_9GAMM